MKSIDRMIGMLESFLFVAGDEGLSLKQLATLTELKQDEVAELLEQLHKSHEVNLQSGITLKQYGGAYHLVTKAEYAKDIQRLLENPVSQSMTKASLEVLAIIAYKQPVTRVEIDDLRGVKSEGALQTLISRGFVMEKGRSEGTGRAILYGTTDLFLNRFGLSALDNLPALEEEEPVEEDTDLFMSQFQEAFSIEDGGGDEA